MSGSASSNTKLLYHHVRSSTSITVASIQLARVLNCELDDVEQERAATELNELGRENGVVQCEVPHSIRAGSGRE